MGITFDPTPLPGVTVRAGRLSSPTTITLASTDYGPAFLTLTATASSNATALPLGSVRIGGGGGASWFVRIAPPLGCAPADYTITLTASDPGGGTATATLGVTVQAPPLPQLRLTLAGTGLGGSPGDPVTCGAANALFDAITAAQAAAGTVEYRCVYLENTSSDFEALAAGLYLAAQIGGSASITGFGLDPSAAGSSVTIGSETTAPSGVTFATPPTTPATRLQVGDIPAATVGKAVWLRRQAGNTPTTEGIDGATLGTAAELEV